LQEAFPGNGSRRSRTLAVIGPAGAALAAVNTWQIRKRALLDADLPPEDSSASLARSIAYGVAMAAGLSAFGEAERQFADRLSRAIARASALRIRSGDRSPTRLPSPVLPRAPGGLP
jgi:hypothetical protein